MQVTVAETEMNKPAPIERRLRWTNPETRETETIEESAIAAIAKPIVILGDPGLGKSVLTDKLGRQGANRYVRAGSFVRSKSPSRFLPQPGGRLIIDGLDEVASAALGGGVDIVLEQLSAIGNPPFILSSREADWRGASARIRIEDDYGEAVSVLHLEPFNGADADAFLRRFFPDVDAGAVLDHLATRGLEEIHRNPLTLHMIGEVARAETRLPDTRAELLDRACTIMLREANPRHEDAPHAVRSNQELLLAAGAMCATSLLCDRAGIYAGTTSKTPDDFLHLSLIENMPFAEAAKESLKTRLFQAEGEARFIPVHRVIAEYLGARWLATCFDCGTSEQRIRSLIVQNDGVPTSLRGLNAWLAHFSSALAPACIAADPYAVLKYGNAETLSLEQARILLRELTRLSSEDPYFRAEDWERHPAAGLMRIELKDEILAILADERTHAHLAFLLLEAMTSSPIAVPLARDLEVLLFDLDRFYGARWRAAEVLMANGALIPLEPIIERLLSLGDRDSQRLAFEILTELGLAAVPMRLAVETLLAYAGVTVSAADRKKIRDHSFHIRRQLFDALDATQLHTFLDDLSEYATPLMEDDNPRTRDEIADAARVAVLAALKSRALVTPEQVWRWLRWVRNSDGYDTDAKNALREQFEENVPLRRRLQAEVLFGAPAGELRSRAFELRDVSERLVPDDDDVIALLELLGTRSEGASDVQRLREVVSLARTRAGLARGVWEAAIKFARDDPSFLRELDDWSKPLVDEFEKKQKRRVARAKAKRRETYRKIREEHAANSNDIRAGGFCWLNRTAQVYLGRFSEFDERDKPEVRVEKFLGPELAEEALNGFVAALHRDDLPSASQIAESHAENRQWTIEPVLVCGIAEMIRRGLPLDSVARPALDSAYMAWRRQREANVESQIDIGPALETIVLADESQTEAFLRTSIEPQLQARLAHIADLYRLRHDPRWSGLAGRLAIEWLSQNPSLPPDTESDLLSAALRHGDRRELAQLSLASHSRVHANFEVLLDWLAVDFVADFNRVRRHLQSAARDDRQFLWYIRRRAAGGRRDALVPLTIQQRAFIVDAFGSSWPQTGRPEGSSSGDTNPWDASDFIERAIHSIGGEVSVEATDTLERLLTSTAVTYGDTLRHALANQRKLRRDHEYTPATINQVQSVASNALPETIDDMRAYFGDRVATVQARMHATNTDMWEAYWDGTKPRGENFCRNRLVEHISGQLPAAIRFEPEMHMPNQKRADIAAIRGAIGLPVEIKGQWHPQVWDAPLKQLAAQYARDWHAEGRGVYIVIWFGEIPDKQLRRHPDGLAAPTTPQGLQHMLIDRIPEAMRDLIDIYVMDVTRS